MDKHDLWAPKRRIETRYRRAILAAIWRLEESLSGLEDPTEILMTIHEFANSESFERYSKAAAGMMVTHLFSDAGKTWREAAHANSNGRMIYEALKKELEGPIGNIINYQIQENAKLIKSLPEDIARQVNQHILNETFKGKRSSDIAAEIKEMFPDASEAKASLIARTEVGKTSTALTQARSQQMGINWYVWRTSEDKRTRDAHKLMDKVLCSFNDPPAPEQLNHEKHVPGHYGPGEIWNCRCYPEPIISLDQISWPAKVYMNGAIHKRVSRKEFEVLISGDSKFIAKKAEPVAYEPPMVKPKPKREKPISREELMKRFVPWLPEKPEASKTEEIPIKPENWENLQSKLVPPKPKAKPKSKPTSKAKKDESKKQKNGERFKTVNKASKNSGSKIPKKQK